VTAIQRETPVDDGLATIIEDLRDLQDATRAAVTESVTRQRKLAEQENEDAKKAIETEGCVFNALTPAEHDGFVAAVAPLLKDAQAMYGADMFRLVPRT